MIHVTPYAFLRMAVLISVAFRCTAAEAVGLGPMRLQSALGQPLRATVQVLGSDARSLSASCIRSRLTSADGSEIVRPETELRRPNGTATEIVISSTASIEEPAVTLLLEITCAPTLNRDYQLLLDLKDGLPRVLSTGGRDLASEAGASAGSRETERPNAAAPRKKRRERIQSPVAASTGGLGAPETLQLLDETTIARPRARGLPGARNVLKLSQDDVSFGMMKTVTTLKLSDSLSTPDDGVTNNSEEILASKARFRAMMQGEDPVVAAQRQVKSLQTRLQQNESDLAAKADAPAARPAPPTAFRTTPILNKWMIALAVLMVVSALMVTMFIRMSRRTTEKKATPWWLAANDAANRENEFLQAARNSVDRSNSGNSGAATPTGDETTPYQDKVLESYVEKYVGNRAPIEDSRIEPHGLDRVYREAPAAEDATPGSRQARDATAGERATDADQSTRASHDPYPMHKARANVATFELVSDVVQEAEFWKMLNETQRAIDILENYCGGESAASPVPWLFLADLYQANGDTEQLDALRERFHSMFNSRFHDNDTATLEGRESLEQYPHVMDRISELWGHDDAVTYLQGLLVNDRDAPREGFHLPVYREILLLIEVALEREKAEA